MILDKNISDSRVRFLLASTYEEKGESKLALEEYQKIPATSELYATARIHAGMIFKNEGKITEAINLIREALEKNKEQIPLYIYLSSLYEEAKDIAAAEKILYEGIKLFPKDVDLRYALGVIYEKTNRFPESMKEMETVLRLDPENAEALNFIGYSYADRGINLEEAEKMIIQALKLKPENGYIIDSLGWVHFKQNKLDSAVKHLQRALKILPDDVNIAEHLGDVYAKIGKNKNAQEMYKRALKLAPNNNSLQKKYEELIKKE